eukprot:scaffold3642_cov182-Amphora_coffeaeformis.AAC.9
MSRLFSQFEIPQVSADDKRPLNGGVMLDSDLGSNNAECSCQTCECYTPPRKKPTTECGSKGRSGVETKLVKKMRGNSSCQAV